MQKLSKIVVFSLISFYCFFNSTNIVSAQCIQKTSRSCPLGNSIGCYVNGGQYCCDSQISCDAFEVDSGQPGGDYSTNSKAIPGLHFPCDKTSDNEFNTLRPYQASPCGPYPKQALFCSNKLVVFESFQLKNECNGQKTGCPDCKWTCNLNYQVEPHNLNITLDESELPIMGNTQDEFDDAQKVNEYASWYLSGVIDKRENENATNDQVVNFSGPLKKLLPAMIQDAQKIEIIRSTKKVSGKEPVATSPLEQDESAEILTDNHDQLVVGNLRLSDWDGSLSYVRTATNIVGSVVSYLLNAQGIEYPLGGWNHAFPPLPWDDGTVEFPDENNPAVPFKDNISYKKAYNEWLGKSCLDLGIFGLQCLDNPLITNKYAELWHFVPLSNNSDSEGKNYLLTGDGPSYVPSQGTEIDSAQHKGFKNALLYFSHMQEVLGLSGLLNKTYTPDGYESEKLPETTEKIKKGTSTKTNDSLDGSSLTGTKDNDTLSTRDPYSNLDCSTVNVRVNEGDDLFPGDRPSGKELFVEGAEYTITQVDCHEENRFEMGECEIKDTNIRYPCPKWINILDCPAEVGIEFKTGTKTPLADEIFSQTVADSGSTFRKIFPKVEEGAPVECIADIPTTTNVTYKLDPNLTQVPAGATHEFKETVYPADGANSGTQLTFPHIGSVYEYFLKGIQTALRPKGFGEPLVNGNCKPTDSPICGELPEGLPKGGGSCSADGASSRLGNLPQNLLDIVSAAAEAYQVPPNLILGIMFGEGRFNSSQGGGYTTYDWTEENVNKWATCEEMPSCHSIPYVYNAAIAISEDNWGRIVEGTSETKGIKSEIKKFAPDREISGCNLLDSIFGIAWLMRDDVNGGPFQVNSCFGKTLNKGGSSASSCGNWSDEDYITAIKINESGWSDMCFTNDNSCATGGGKDAACITGGDTCQKYNDPTGSKRYTSPSHMACVFDVAKGN